MSGKTAFSGYAYMYVLPWFYLHVRMVELKKSQLGILAYFPKTCGAHIRCPHSMTHHGNWYISTFYIDHYTCDGTSDRTCPCSDSSLLLLLDTWFKWMGAETTRKPALSVLCWARLHIYMEQARVCTWQSAAQLTQNLKKQSRLWLVLQFSKSNKTFFG